MWIRRRSELFVVVGLLLASADASAAPPQPASGGAAAQDDPLAQYRERFKLGMDAYKAGAVAEAVGYWEPIYRDLGEQKGYRLAYNLGLAYAELGEATHAAERLQSFLSEVGARRAHGDAVAPIVQREEGDARARLDALMATKGRIRVDAGDPPRAVQIDASEARLAGFVAWVAPGRHRVTFSPGTQEVETKTIDVQAGSLVEVSPSPPASASMASVPAMASTSPSTMPSAPAPPLPPPAYLRRQTERPFSPMLVALSGGLTLAASIAAVPLESHAWTLHDRYVAEQQSNLTIAASDRQSFETARTWAYATVGTAVGLGVVTAALAAWYFLGTSTREVTITPAGVAGRF
jgi:hypothetical protein